MSQLSILASTYIERNKEYLRKKYDDKHHKGVIVLLFDSDGSFYKDYFLTKSEVQLSHTLPSDAVSYAQCNWLAPRNQFIFLSWFYPITPGNPFNLYCLPTAMQTVIDNFDRKYSNPSAQKRLNNSDDDAWGCLFYCLGLFLLVVFIIIIGSLA